MFRRTTQTGNLLYGKISPDSNVFNHKLPDFMDIDISVIVPVYNAEDYIVRCIESVRNQSFENWHLVLIDDGSKDNSYKICQQFAKSDNRIQVIHQENSGAGAARNTGLALAKGEYIVFLDSDDYIDKDYFLMLSNHDEDVVFIDVEAVDEGGNVVRKEYMSDYKHTSKDDFMRAQMTGKINWGGVRKVVKREIIENHNIRYSDHKVGEEVLFTYASVFYSKTIAFIDKPVYFYIQRDDSLSHSKMDNPWGEVALALKAKTIENGSYIEYANTINAFILTAAAVSSDRLVTNYEKDEYRCKIEVLYNSLMQNLDLSYPIDYRHMSFKARLLGQLILARRFGFVRMISKIKHLVG